MSSDWLSCMIDSWDGRQVIVFKESIKSLRYFICCDPSESRASNQLFFKKEVFYFSETLHQTQECPYVCPNDPANRLQYARLRTIQVSWKESPVGGQEVGISS